ncbi:MULTISPECIES: UDP-N-acetylglucosamine--undecaprenyl-phosphate N-acetylglucosaminephosphotransferase [unclassified Shewanella]|uniref:UDP-N-acetylglucosamine--undecaprenyl-phosphate N-acetylglucosaminephosphotransferase n=1 Tax=unclassified Shewanella TaxID=196818 RepID=UPI001BBAE7AE|nr:MULTISPECIES: UDP-N-acetylglucosamine--undecaprenyl-phosphate N-acetylglucosaminephosphotransferase [unclassified Shewanella]GIU18070.1 undecaprenyl-phosphate alpha-N-acetylglucosaminyl 1-phosphate transferase [Shewanella sp. MBTL60-112-B1]GIU38909.1 undecaprenyl-phosphate alpha-N-acetylglucosaminyl 1-phosphate transferase [Shewanella sp. MBTL60-112-B2]
MSLSLCFAFIASFSSLLTLRKFAKRIGLVDKPNERKHHEGQIPLIGGISIFLSLLFTLLLFTPLDKNVVLYICCSTVLVGLGAIDDRFDISFKVRLVIQAAISLAMILVGEKSLHNLGCLMGSEVIQLPLLVSYLVTILGVIGAINAFNMVDGIDGLLGGLASVTFGALGVLFYQSGNTELAKYCLLIVVAILPYILLNLGIPLGQRFKVFMGDAGSIFIGFTVIWLLIEASQGARSNAIRPVTALWLIGLPLMDMVCIMVRRMRKGQSPFKPDREHLHHICQRIGFSSRSSLLVICLMASIMAGVGIWSELHSVNETIMFVAFLIAFAIYFYVIAYIWKITAFIKKKVKVPVSSLNS